MPAALAGTAFPMPFAPGTEIVCMQGNNTMTAQSSHGPDQLRYALDLNGTTGVVMTNLDVLSVFHEIPVCVSYEIAGRSGAAREFPGQTTPLEGVRPQCVKRAGWSSDISGVRHHRDLPRAAREYVEWVENEIGVPIELLSVGPERDAVIPRA